MKNITKTKKRLLVALFLPSLLALTVFTGCWENTDIRPFADPNAVNTTILEARPAGGWVDNPVLLNTQRPDVLWRAVGASLGEAMLGPPLRNSKVPCKHNDALQSYASSPVATKLYLA